jgi:hypothetical protein
MLVATVRLLASLEDTAFCGDFAVMPGAEKKLELRDLDGSERRASMISLQFAASLPQFGVLRIVLCAAIWLEIRLLRAIPAQTSWSK